MAGHLQLQLLHEYQEINPTNHETVVGPPTALQFMRMVHVSRPVLFEDCHLSLRALWTDDYLASNVANVQVAITPDGRADALVRDEDGTVYFVEPLVETMPMGELLGRLSTGSHRTTDEVVYLQSQNDNLNLATPSTDGEFKNIRNDIPSDIPWATEALGRGPDAVNIWIGNHHSVTSVHCDPYQNIYAVIRGTKVFTLFPPTEGWCLREQEYPHARWSRDQNGKLSLTPTTENPVRWSSIRDPTGDLPPTRPIRVIVREGQMLYLPVGWWHYVQQVPDMSGVVVAVNYWYDPEYQGHQMVFLNLLRSLSVRTG